MKFKESSQHKRWSFTSDQLVSQRELEREKSLQRIIKLRSGSEKHQDDVITLEEEASLLKYYESRVINMCKELRLPRKVVSSAVYYFKRFFLRHSILDYSPLPLVLTCLYVSCKIEESYISASELGRLTGTQPDIVLRTELTLLQGLGFDLITFSPFRAVDGFVEVIQDRMSTDTSSSAFLFTRMCTNEENARAKALAYSAVESLFLSDAPLLHTPGRIALAATRAAYAKIGIRIDKYIELVAGSDIEKLTAALDMLDVLGAQGAKSVTQDDAAELDKKLKTCRNPLLDPTSDAAKAAAEEKAKVKAEKKVTKSADLAQVVGVGDFPEAKKQKL